MTAATEVGLYNLALSLIGSTRSVASTSEASQEAETCLLWYDEVRDRVLNAAPWSSAKTFARLSLDVERDTDEDWTEADPAPGWTYSYILPENMLRPRYITGYQRFELGIDGSGQKRLFTDFEDPILVYTLTQTTDADIAKWDHNLKMAVVHALAGYICMPLTGKIQRTLLNIEQANEAINEARSINANTTEEQLDSVPEWISARGYGGYAPGIRYVYPFGPLLTATTAPTT